MSGSKMRFHVEAVRLDGRGSVARCRQAEITLDTDLAGNPNAFNPAELLLAALSACIIKGRLAQPFFPVPLFNLRVATCPEAAVRIIPST